MHAGEVNEMTNNAYDKFKEEHKEEYDAPIDLDKVNALCILADINQGKTNLGIYYLRNYKGNRKIYLYGYPRKIDNFNIIESFRDLLKVKNSIIYIDEIGRQFKFYNKRTSERFLELLSMLAQKNNTLIFSAQITQMITRPIESFIDCWAIKRIDLDSLKWGSKPKRIIQDIASWKKSDWALDLNKDEYFEYSDRNEFGQNRIKRFPFQNIKKDWM